MQNDNPHSPTAPAAPQPSGLEFIETPVFTEEWERIGLDDEALLVLQTKLLIHPDAGDLIPRSHGLRKLRIAAKGKGARGGARVIYYWIRSDTQIVLVLVYPKNELDDLTPKQLRELRALVAD